MGSLKPHPNLGLERRFGFREVNSPVQSYGEQAAEPGPELGPSDGYWFLGRSVLPDPVTLSCMLTPFKGRLLPAPPTSGIFRIVEET